MFLSQLLTIATIHILAVMSPGPDLTIIIKNATSHGKKTGVFTALGIGTGILIHSSYALLGVALLIANTPWLFQAIKYIGAIYLIYLGVTSIKNSGNYSLKVSKQTSIQQLSNTKAYFNGVLTNLLNPNVSLFFLTIFTQVIKPGTPVNHQIIYALEMAIATVLWFSFLSISLNNKFTKTFFEKYKIWIDRIMGTILILLAIKVIFSL